MSANSSKCFSSLPSGTFTCKANQTYWHCFLALTRISCNEMEGLSLCKGRNLGCSRSGNFKTTLLLTDIMYCKSLGYTYPRCLVFQEDVMTLWRCGKSCVYWAGHWIYLLWAWGCWDVQLCTAQLAEVMPPLKSVCLSLLLNSGLWQI